MTSTNSGADIQNELDQLTRSTSEDISASNNNVSPLTARLFDKNVEIDQRMKIMGEAISCTLLANNHRGGYTTDNNGIQVFKKHLEGDFGFKLDYYAEQFGLTMRNFLTSEYMRPYVRMTVSQYGDEIFEGCQFENDLLAELMSEIKAGHKTQEMKNQRKATDRLVRMKMARINRDGVEGRLRIYKIVDQLGGSKNAVSYQNVQTKYNEIYGKPLNKQEMKSFFGVGEALKVLQEYVADDVAVKVDQNHNGAIYLQLRRPVAEIEQDYAKLLEEAQSLPDPAESIQSANKSRTKKTRSNLEFNEDSLMSRNALLSQDNDESDTDEPPKIVRKSNSVIRNAQILKENHVQLNPHTSVYDRLEREKPQSSSHPNDTLTSLSTSRIATNVEEVNVKELVIKAYVYGFLKSIQPMMAPVFGLIKKTGMYMKSQGLKMSNIEIGDFLRNLDDELKFHENGLFVSSKVKKSSRHK